MKPDRWNTNKKRAPQMRQESIAEVMSEWGFEGWIRVCQSCPFSTEPSIGRIAYGNTQHNIISWSTPILYYILRHYVFIKYSWASISYMTTLFLVSFFTSIATIFNKQIRVHLWNSIYFLLLVACVCFMPSAFSPGSRGWNLLRIFETRDSWTFDRHHLFTYFF